MTEAVHRERQSLSDMTRDAAQAKHDLERAHSMELNAMQAHLVKIHNEARLQQMREQSAQTTMTSATISSGTRSTKSSETENGGLGSGKSASKSTTSQQSLEESLEYSMDSFEVSQSAEVLPSPVQTKLSPASTRNNNNNLAGSQLLDSIAEELPSPSRSPSQNTIDESIGNSYNDDDFETSVLLHPEESIAEEVYDHSMFEETTEHTPSSVKKHKNAQKKQSKDECSSKKQSSRKQSTKIQSKQQILDSSSSSDHNSSYSTRTDDSYDDSDSSYTTRRTDRLMRRVVGDLEDKQRHEDQLFDMKVDKIKNDFSLRLRSLVEQRQKGDLAGELFDKAKEMATLTYKSSVAEVERERSSMHARHYRDVVRLQRRHAPDAPGVNQLPTTKERRERRIESRMEPRSASKSASKSTSKSASKSASKTAGKSSVNVSSSGGDGGLEEDLVGDVVVDSSGDDNGDDILEDSGLLIQSSMNDSMLNVKIPDETTISSRTTQQRRSLSGSVSLQSDGGMYDDDDFEDDFEEETNESSSHKYSEEESLRIDEIQSELEDVRQSFHAEKQQLLHRGDSDNTINNNNEMETSTDRVNRDFEKRERALASKRAQATALLAEKRAIIARAARRIRIEEEELEVKEMMAAALALDVNVEVLKMTAHDNKKAQHHNPLEKEIQVQQDQEQDSETNNTELVDMVQEQVVGGGGISEAEVNATMDGYVNSADTLVFHGQAVRLGLSRKDGALGAISSEKQNNGWWNITLKEDGFTVKRRTGTFDVLPKGYTKELNTTTSTTTTVLEGLDTTSVTPEGSSSANSGNSDDNTYNEDTFEEDSNNNNNNSTLVTQLKENMLQEQQQQENDPFGDDDEIVFSEDDSNEDNNQATKSDNGSGYGDDMFEEDNESLAESLVSLESIAEDVVEENMNDNDSSMMGSSGEDDSIMHAPVLETPNLNDSQQSGFGEGGLDDVEGVAETDSTDVIDGSSTRVAPAKETKDAVDLSESWDKGDQSMSHDQNLEGSLSDSARAFVLQSPKSTVSGAAAAKEEEKDSQGEESFVIEDDNEEEEDYLMDSEIIFEEDTDKALLPSSFDVVEEAQPPSSLVAVLISSAVSIQTRHRGNVGRQHYHLLVEQKEQAEAQVLQAKNAAAERIARFEAAAKARKEEEERIAEERKREKQERVRKAKERMQKMVEKEEEEERKRIAKQEMEELQMLEAMKKKKEERIEKERLKNEQQKQQQQKKQTQEKEAAAAAATVAALALQKVKEEKEAALVLQKAKERAEAEAKRRATLLNFDIIESAETPCSLPVKVVTEEVVEEVMEEQTVLDSLTLTRSSEDTSVSTAPSGGSGGSSGGSGSSGSDHNSSDGSAAESLSPSSSPSSTTVGTTTSSSPSAVVMAPPMDTPPPTGVTALRGLFSPSSSSKERRESVTSTNLMMPPSPIVIAPMVDFDVVEDAEPPCALSGLVDTSSHEKNTNVDANEKNDENHNHDLSPLPTTTTMTTTPTKIRDEKDEESSGKGSDRTASSPGFPSTFSPIASPSNDEEGMSISTNKERESLTEKITDMIFDDLKKDVIERAKRNQTITSPTTLLQRITSTTENVTEQTISKSSSPTLSSPLSPLSTVNETSKATTTATTAIPSVEDEDDDDLYDFGGFSDSSNNLPSLPGMSSSASASASDEDPMGLVGGQSNDGGQSSSNGDHGIVPNERDAALKQEEEILDDTRQWYLHGKVYLSRLYRRIGLLGGSNEQHVFETLMLLKKNVSEEHEGEAEEAGNALPLSVFVAMEQEDRSSTGNIIGIRDTPPPPPQGATVESVQIYHKLLFDSTNDAFLRYRDAHQYRTQQMTHNGTTTTPWIRRHTGALSSRGRLPRNARELCAKVSQDVVKWDAVEEKPELARTTSTSYTLGTTLTETLTTDERLNAVLSSEVYTMEVEWRRQYEMVEASVKASIADQILIDLLEDTARATKRVAQEKRKYPDNNIH